MAEKEVPLSVAERHKILFIESTPKEELISYGKKYLSKGMLYDALEYFEKAGAEDYMNQIKEKSIEEGDIVLYQNVCHSLKQEMGKDELIKLKENAEKMGKESVSNSVAILLISKEKK